MSTAPLLSGILAEETVRRMPPGLTNVYFDNAGTEGTEGIEAAIKFARCAARRDGLVACALAFHGLSAGALSLNGCPSFRGGFGPRLGTRRLIPSNDIAA